MRAGGDATSIPLSNIIYHTTKTTFTSHALHHGIGNLDQLSVLSLVVTFFQPLNILTHKPVCKKYCAYTPALASRLSECSSGATVSGRDMKPHTQEHERSGTRSGTGDIFGSGAVVY